MSSLQLCQVTYIAMLQLQTNFTIELNNSIENASVQEEIDAYVVIKKDVANCVLKCYNALLKEDFEACDDFFRVVLQVYIDFLDIKSKTI